MHTLDQFVGAHIAPPLKDAGFKRRRREFILKGPRGALGVVGVYPDDRGADAALAFELQYGVVTAPLVEWRRSRGIPIPDWLSPSEALMRGLIFHPGWGVDGDPSDIFPYRWVVPQTSSEEAAAVGELVTRALAREAIPTIHEWFVPRALAAAFTQLVTLGRFPGMGPRACAVSMALLEDGPSADLDDALAALAPDDNVRTWIEHKLASDQR